MAFGARGGEAAAARGRLARVVLAIALAGCASESEDGGGAGSPWTPGTWVYGGQTGSLEPVCGLAAAARATDVPASAGGIVVDTRDCSSGESAFGLFDAEGRAVPFATQRLDGGTLLLVPQSGLMPGSYVVGAVSGEPASVDGGAEDQDAGADADAGGVGPAVGVPSAMLGDDAAPVSVVAAAAPALRLGTLEHVGAECVASFELVLDASAVAYAPQLALDVSIDDAAPRRLVEFGALEVHDGRVMLGLPQDIVGALSAGAERITISARLAGSDDSIAPAELALSCQVPGPIHRAYSDEDPGGCSVASLRSSARGALLAACSSSLLALLARRRRRRRRRPPD